MLGVYTWSPFNAAMPFSSVLCTAFTMPIRKYCSLPHMFSLPSRNCLSFWEPSLHHMLQCFTHQEHAHSIMSSKHSFQSNRLPRSPTWLHFMIDHYTVCCPPFVCWSFNWVCKRFVAIATISRQSIAEFHWVGANAGLAEWPVFGRRVCHLLQKVTVFWADNPYSLTCLHHTYTYTWSHH